MVPPPSIDARSRHHGCATVRAWSRPKIASSYAFRNSGSAAASASRSGVICCSIRTGLCAVARHSV